MSRLVFVGILLCLVGLPAVSSAGDCDVLGELMEYVFRPCQFFDLLTFLEAP